LSKQYQIQWRGWNIYREPSPSTIEISIIAYNFSIGFWSCSDDVLFLLFFILLFQQLLWYIVITNFNWGWKQIAEKQQSVERYVVLLGHIILTPVRNKHLKSSMIIQIFEHTLWRLFQKCVVRTKCYIYVFIANTGPIFLLVGY
jgi:hypothetical protein